MYTVVLHDITDPQAAFARGQQLMANEGAPHGTRVLQFYPSLDHTQVTCLWESDSVASLQDYVDAVLGDSSVNICYPVDAEQAFSERPAALAAVGPPRSPDTCVRARKGGSSGRSPFLDAARGAVRFPDRASIRASTSATST